jgi:hypothetical protein
MNLDDFKEPWQQRQRALDGRVDHVIKKVRSRMAGFDRTIWWRDMRESLAAILLIVWYCYDLFQQQSALAKCGAGLGIVACVFILAVLHWARVKGKGARPDLPVEDYRWAELDRVDRQIWLLRNVHWWYLGPLLIAVAVQIAAMMPDPEGLVMFATSVIPLFGFIYWLNQVAVKNQLMPLRQELINPTDEDTNDEDTTDVDSPHEGTTSDKASVPLEPLVQKRRDMIFAIVALFTVMILGGLLSDWIGISADAPKVSPFTEMRFEEDQIVVTYQHQECQWLEIDGIKVEDITRAAKIRFWGNWQKRVREDLVGVLWKMGHQPADTVSLSLRNLETDQQLFVEEALMTGSNRAAVANNLRHDSE